MTNDEIDALGSVIARYESAQTNMLSAILSVLVRHQILPAETVKHEILDGIRDTFLPIARSGDQKSEDSLEAQATLRLNARIRSILFGVHEA